MDKNANVSHSINEPAIVSLGLCNESTGGGEKSTNVLGNDKNVNRSSKKLEEKKSRLKSRILKEMKTNQKDKTETVDSALNDEQLADIYKLPVELLADIFDYLPLKDLCSIRQTSQWFHQVAGFSFQRNYSALWRNIQHQKDMGSNAFHELFQGVIIHENYYWYVRRQPEFQQVKRVQLYRCNACLEIEKFKDVLSQTECLIMNECSIRKTFTENISIFIPNLKQLSLIYRQPGSEWFNCKYPKLEKFELTSAFRENVEIGPFLEINPNIRKLAIDSYRFWDNRESIRAAKLEDLAIIIYDDFKKPYFDFESFCQLLNELYELGSYKKLKLYFGCYYSRKELKFYKLSSLRALNKLNVGAVITHCLPNRYTERFSMSHLHILEEMYVTLSYCINDIEATAKNLINLKRIQFRWADINDIMMFIKNSTELTKIRVKHFVCTASFILKKTKEEVIYNGDVGEADSQKQKVIDLPLLNAERAKLKNAKRVMLYVTEEVYLATKWAMRETDFQFIQLKRIESYDWDTEFLRGI